MAVIIDSKEYLDLLNDSAELYLLGRGGVTNWDWYDESLWGNEEESLDKLKEENRETVRRMEEEYKALIVGLSK